MLDGALSSGTIALLITLAVNLLALAAAYWRLVVRIEKQDDGIKSTASDIQKVTTSLGSVQKKVQDIAVQLEKYHGDLRVMSSELKSLETRSGERAQRLDSHGSRILALERKANGGGQK